MFKKVLIAEDHESSGISVLKTLIDLEITDTHFVYYCDDAMERVKRSVLDHTFLLPIFLSMKITGRRL